MTIGWIEYVQRRGWTRPLRQHTDQLAVVHVVLNDGLEMLPDAQSGEQHFLEAVAFIGGIGAIAHFDAPVTLLENQWFRFTRSGKKIAGLEVVERQILRGKRHTSGSR